MTPNSAPKEITTMAAVQRFPRMAARAISDKSANDQAARMARDVRGADTWPIDATPFVGTAAKATAGFGIVRSGQCFESQIPPSERKVNMKTARLLEYRKPVDEPVDSNVSIDADRREVLRSLGGAAISGIAASALAMSSPGSAQNAASANANVDTENRDNAPLGSRLQGVQHFGVTVQNMDRAFEFYTEVLGGNEVMRDGDFHGEKIHATLLTDQEIIARERKVNPRTIGVPDLKGGEQRLDVRFVQFDNVVIELLQYRDVQQPMGNGNSWAEPRDHMSPAYPRSMHICFYIRDDVDFNKFIHDLEAESTRRGMSQVKANRVITVGSEQERQAAPLDANTNKITAGKSNGWALIYCKGPEGEQLEFVQALGPVKRTFQEALETRRLMLAARG